MKTLDQIREVLQEHKDELADRFKVSKLKTYSSYARGDHDEHGFDFIHLADRLEELVGMKVDLLTPDSIKPNRRESILSSVVDVSP